MKNPWAVRLEVTMAFSIPLGGRKACDRPLLPGSCPSLKTNGLLLL